MQGRVFVTASGRRGVVGPLLGSGGQGDVYEVSLDGVSFALKWYHRHYLAIDTGLRARLETSVRRGAPTADFLWPLDLAGIPGHSGFGYLMQLRSDRFRSIRDLIAPPPRRLDLSLATRATICQHLARDFLELHANGFCYQDINFGNIFLDPASGRVLICDNDNVSIDGAEANIYGTRKFMAPEVVRREALPDSRTDLFSMAVLFFYALFGWHPLDGRREAETKLLDADAELRLYGTEPLFLFDPVDTRNGPVPGYHDALAARWRSLPGALRTLFVRAFTDGLHDQSARVLETEWRAALGAVIEATLACDGCGFEHVADGQADAVVPPLCLACAAPLATPLLLVIGQRAFLLEPGRVVPGEAIDRRLGLDRAAEVAAHPTRPDLLGLRNLTQASWQVTLPDGAAHTVAPGQSVRLLDGASIGFGRGVGRIVGSPVAMEAAR